MRSLFVGVLMVLTTMGIASAQSAQTPRLDARLDPIAFAVGKWRCSGTYLAPLFTPHTVEAIAKFTPDLVTGIGDSATAQWISVNYQENKSSNGQVLGIHDAITIFNGVGQRALYDGNGGRMHGSFTVAGHHLEFVGDYIIGDQPPAPFTETVDYNDVADSFTSESRIFGVPFHTQRCTKVTD